jgi:hypothetical protein
MTASNLRSRPRARSHPGQRPGCSSAHAQRWLATSGDSRTLSQARRLDRDNPRLALVEAWHTVPDTKPLEAAAVDEGVTKLEAVVGLFETASSGPRTPGWGEAEALALLGSLYLERGSTRAARDVLERALLAAPGYTYAVELMNIIGR